MERSVPSQILSPLSPGVSSSANQIDLTDKNATLRLAESKVSCYRARSNSVGCIARFNKF